METAGYSGTPLEKKLGIKPGMVIRLVNEPKHYLGLFQFWPEGLVYEEGEGVLKDFIHYFARENAVLQADFPLLVQEMKENAMLWVSWPKQAAKTETDLNGNIVRDSGRKQGLIDIKVCAVDSTWSAIKFVKRIKDRK